MGLTVTEKNHWKERIAQRIDKRIEAIYAEDPNLRERVKRESKAAAIDSLGLTAMQTRLDEIQALKDQLERETAELHRSQLAAVRSVRVQDILGYESGYSQHHEVTVAIERRQAVHAQQLLVQDEHGRIVLQLKEEKDNLLDTIWLATSTVQLKQLWAKVNSLLGVTATQLEQDALAIPPVEDQ